tara:strand:- start:232 stop:414 length:183 start_codon:yes stop_codon:yes gene_type:complete
MFSRKDLDLKEITFKRQNYKVGISSVNRKMLTGNFWKLFTLKNGQVYAYSKIDLMVYRTH